jgi:prepilin-type N-terminal cleavage/methylation domain-containing protein
MMHSHRLSRGFTLIETLIVIAILGILATLIVVSLSDARKKSRDAQRKTDLANVQLALELYADDNEGVYPIMRDGADPYLSFQGLEGYQDGTEGAFIEGLLGDKKYLAALPQDPLDRGVYRYYYATCNAVGEVVDRNSDELALYYELNAVLEFEGDNDAVLDNGDDVDPTGTGLTRMYEIGRLTSCMPLAAAGGGGE